MLALGFDWAGTAEGETLVGTSVTDRFDGAGGDDILSGGRGNDRYVFRAGSGHDEVRGSTGRFQFSRPADFRRSSINDPSTRTV